MISSAIVSRYAGALADVATGPSAASLPPQQIAEQLRSFAAVIESSHELRTALVTPSIPLARKKAVVGKLSERLGLSGVSRNFLFVLVDHRRIDALREIAEGFELELDSRLGFARAQVTAARGLDARQQELLRAELERVAGKKIKMQFSVDPALIGGLVARIGSTVYDGSVRGRLDALGQRLRAE